MSPRAAIRPTPKGARTRARLLEAARAALLENAGELVFADVAARAGVSAGAPYRHFASKSDLIVAVVEQFFDAFEDEVYRPTFEDEADDWWGGECIRIARFVDVFERDPVGPQIVRGLSGDAKVARALRERLDRQSRGAAANIARGQALGVVRADLDPTLIGALLMGGIYQALSVAYADQPRPDARLTRDLTAFMARVIGLEDRHG